MANVNDVLKKKIGMAPEAAPAVAPAEAATAEVVDAIETDPATATPEINAEHIIALGHMCIANQTALMQLVEILRPMLEEHGMVMQTLEKMVPDHENMTQAMGHLVPQHVAMAKHLSGQQAMAAPVAPQVPVAPTNV